MIDIKQKFIDYNKTLRSLKPIYIVVHDTGDPGATAQNENDYFAGGDRNASADFFVDSNNIIQIMDTDNYYSWHCGDGKGKYSISNGNSIGVEMCLESDGSLSEITVNHTVELVKYLMDKYNIEINNVVRHYDASRKTGWIEDKGKDYCLFSDGSMICDCELYGYGFDGDGVAVKLG